MHWGEKREEMNMKGKKNIVLRIIAFLGAIVIIGFILYEANIFVDNPISASIAQSEIRKYVDNKYNGEDIELSSTKYNIYRCSYEVTATSKKENVDFIINYLWGKVTDGYDCRIN